MSKIAALNKTTELEALKSKILADQVCPELAEQSTQLVFGDGNTDADIVFIGEAPGKNEDLQGLPFVGAAGKFLNEMLSLIGLERKDVYITNIVKYRPPNNRDPLPEEKAVFLPYLWKQIMIIEPKLIVTLGRHSMEAFLPGASISKVHGQPKRIHVRAGVPGVDAMQGAVEKRTGSYQLYEPEVSQAATPQSAAKTIVVSGLAGKQDSPAWVILPLYHPAAALYNGGMRQTLMDDFTLIPNILKKIN